jgi:hypothetical protein
MRGLKMDRDQHITQDAAEHYAVYLMAKTAEELGVAKAQSSADIWSEFVGYLEARNWKFEVEFSNIYPKYKLNAEKQIPNFVKRLVSSFPDSKFLFTIDEANFRVAGRKADFTVESTVPSNLSHVSLKNYIGEGGIKRPQVSSGTFLSFANGFVFERSGVGVYIDPRSEDTTFKGSDSDSREQVLKYTNHEGLIPHIQKLEDLQQQVRDELLKVRFYDANKVRKVIEAIVPVAQDQMLTIFSILGEKVVRKKLVERIGLDGEEDMLFFDSTDSIDSITNPKFRQFCQLINDEGSTHFQMRSVGQSLKFEFLRGDKLLLDVDIPLTINTNGAWHRPKERYSGTQPKNDKGVVVDLMWGEIRPRKSKEIATSTNSYLSLAKTGIFI